MVCVHNLQVVHCYFALLLSQSLICSLGDPFTYSFIHPFTHPFSHSFIHSLTHSLTHSLVSGAAAQCAVCLRLCIYQQKWCVSVQAKQNAVAWAGHKRWKDLSCVCWVLANTVLNNLPNQSQRLTGLSSNVFSLLCQWSKHQSANTSCVVTQGGQCCLRAHSSP